MKLFVKATKVYIPIMFFAFMFGAVIYITMYSDSWKFLAGAGLLTLFFVVKSGQNLSFWLKYPLSVKGWMDNWGNLSTYFEYSPDIRRAIYTTNAIEAMHRQIRKITKTKGAFTSDQALMKLVYLTIKDISKKWTMPIRNWGLTISQLYMVNGLKPSAAPINVWGSFSPKH